MADNFNVKKFLAENKLGPYSRIKEGEAAYEYEKGKAAGEKEEKAKLKEYEVIYVYGEDGKCYRKDDENNYDEVNDYYCRMYAEGKEELKKEDADTQAEKDMDFLAEYEVIYVVQNGKCYRITDEGYKDEVSMDKCRMYAETKKEPTEEALGGKNPEGDALVLRFLQGVAKKFDYPVAKAAIFVKDTIKSLGY